MNIEPRESRIAPATLVNPTTVTYTDVDGDDVTVKITKGAFDLASNFLFIDTDPSPAVREQLQRITVSSIEFEARAIGYTLRPTRLSCRSQSERRHCRAALWANTTRRRSPRLVAFHFTNGT